MVYLNISMTVNKFGTANLYYLLVFWWLLPYLKNYAMENKMSMIINNQIMYIFEMFQWNTPHLVYVDKVSLHISGCIKTLCSRTFFHFLMEKWYFSLLLVM